MLDTWRDRQGELADTAIRLALEKGDVQALRLIVDRLVARADSQPIRWQWSTDLKTAEDIRAESKALLMAVGGGALTLGQVKELTTILESHAGMIERGAAGSRRTEFELDERVLDKIRAQPKLFRAACKLLDFYQQMLDELDFERQHPVVELPRAIAAKPN